MKQRIDKTFPQPYICVYICTIHTSVRIELWNISRYMLNVLNKCEPFISYGLERQTLHITTTNTLFEKSTYAIASAMVVCTLATVKAIHNATKETNANNKTAAATAAAAPNDDDNYTCSLLR